MSGIKLACGVACIFILQLVGCRDQGQPEDKLVMSDSIDSIMIDQISYGNFTHIHTVTFNNRGNKTLLILRAWDDKGRLLEPAEVDGGKVRPSRQRFPITIAPAAAKTFIVAEAPKSLTVETDRGAYRWTPGQNWSALKR